MPDDLCWSSFFPRFWDRITSFWLLPQISVGAVSFQGLDFRLEASGWMASRALSSWFHKAQSYDVEQPHSMPNCHAKMRHLKKECSKCGQEETKKGKKGQRKGRANIHQEANCSIPLKAERAATLETYNTSWPTRKHAAAVQALCLPCMYLYKYLCILRLCIRTCVRAYKHKHA